MKKYNSNEFWSKFSSKKTFKILLDKLIKDLPYLSKNSVSRFFSSQSEDSIINEPIQYSTGPSPYSALRSNLSKLTKDFKLITWIVENKGNINNYVIEVKPNVKNQDDIEIESYIENQNNDWILKEQEEYTKRNFHDDTYDDIDEV